MDFRLNICDIIMCILLTRESLTEAVIFQVSSGDGRRQGPGRLRRVFQTQGTGCYQTLSQGEMVAGLRDQERHVWPEHRVVRRGKR